MVIVVDVMVVKVVAVVVVVKVVVVEVEHSVRSACAETQPANWRSRPAAPLLPVAPLLPDPVGVLNVRLNDDRSANASSISLAD